MITAIFSRLAILVFGTLYPAYASYKAVRTKNVKEYVKWMMYWIVFAFFTCIETFTDIFLSWLPLYYEVKVIVVLWLLNPATKGSSVLYRKFVHPMLTRREQEIDEYLNQAKERGYTAVIQLGSKGVNYATNVIMQTALKTFGQGSMQLDQRRMIPTSRSENAISSRYGLRNRATISTNNDQTDNSNNDIGQSSKNNNKNNIMTRSQSMDIQSPSLFAFQDEYLYQGSSDDERFIAQSFESYDEFDENFGDALQSTTVVQQQGAARSRILPKRKTRSASVPSKNEKQQQQQQSNNINNKKQTANGNLYSVKGRKRLRELASNNIDPNIDIE